MFHGASVTSSFLTIDTQAQPSYLMLPTDVVHMKISSKRLQQPLDLERPINNPEVEQFVLDEIVKLIEDAKHETIILVDACAVRHGVKKEVAELVRRTGFPVYSAPMGKTSFDEQYERYGGVRQTMHDIVSSLIAFDHADLRRLPQSPGDQGEG